MGRYIEGVDRTQALLFPERLDDWVDEDSTVEDTRHFEVLRKLEFFTEFENIELWEILLGLTKASTFLSMFAMVGVYWAHFGLWFAVGLVVSFIVALVVIRWLIGFVATHSLRVFAWYRIAITVPAQVSGFDTRGSSIELATSLDDYAEIWVDGELPRAAEKLFPHGTGDTDA